MRQNFSIGALATVTGCKVVTIRYYEKIGLLAEPGRNRGGHRIYDRRHLERLVFIRKARELGFPLGTVRELLSLSARPVEAPCSEVDSIAIARLAEVRGKIADLKALEATLSRLLTQCGHTTLDDCRILDAFRADPDMTVSG